MHKVVDVGSSENEELARFVATAQSRRPKSWVHVERLKAACAPTRGSNPELRDLLRRVWWLERELEGLRIQSRSLQAQLAQALRAMPGDIGSIVPSAANAGTYADSA